MSFGRIRFEWFNRHNKLLVTWWNDSRRLNIVLFYMVFLRRYFEVFSIKVKQIKVLFMSKFNFWHADMLQSSYIDLFTLKQMNSEPWWNI